jgi:protein phosphatase PTC7
LLVEEVTDLASETSKAGQETESEDFSLFLDQGSNNLKMKMKICFLVAVLSCQVGYSSAFIPSLGRQQVASACRQTRGPTSSLFASLEPLGSEGEWTAYLDEDTTGLVYYFNGKTGEALWEPPTKSFPKVTLEAPMKKQADAKLAEYEKSRSEQPAQKKGFFETLMDDKPEAATAEKETKGKPEQEDWFNFLKDEKQQQASVAATAKKEEKSTATPATKDVNGSGETADKAVTTEAKPSFFDTILQKTKERAATAASELGEAQTTQKVPEELIVVEEEEKKIQINMASYVLPHPAKVFWGGEDAVFTQGRTFGVFDGVSGATKLDGVPLYSKTLATRMKKAVGIEGLTIAELVKRLTTVAEFADEKATGASTAIVASIGEDGFLRALSLGDSSCVVIRNGKVTAKTKDIQHYFDCPYQLSADSPDRPKDGTKLNLELMKGDLILMGSDGIFDNLSGEELVAIVSSSPPRLSTIAKRVGDQSRKVSLNKQAVTPYGKLAKKNGDPDYADGLGGKLDDVCCIVVRYE